MVQERWKSKTTVEGIDELLKREMGHHDSKEIQYVDERIEELHKDVPCSLVTSVEEDLFEAPAPLITREGHVTSQGLVMFDESKERIEEEPRTLVWYSSRLPSNSHEFAAFTHGITDEEESIGVGTQSASIGHNIFNEEVLVKVKYMTQMYDNNSDFYNSSSISSRQHKVVDLSHHDDGTIQSFHVGTQVVGD